MITMTMYRREVKYKWLWWNGRGSYVLSDETEWMSEEEAKGKNIKTYDTGLQCCREYERFIPVEN